MSRSNAAQNCIEEETLEELTKRVQFVLRHLENPQKLNESALISSCLAIKYFHEKSGTTSYEALKQVFTGVLETLNENSPTHAEVLRRQYWERRDTTETIANQLGLALSTYQVYRGEAVERFAFILQEREKLCQQHELKKRQTKKKWLTLTIIGLLIGAGIIGIITVLPLSTIAIFTKERGVCNETVRLEAPPINRFVRDQGVSIFTIENTESAVLSNQVRAVTMDSRGLWIGYFATTDYPANGLGHYNKATWADCNQQDGVAGKNINAIEIDQQGNIWVATEESGVAMFDGNIWHFFTTQDGLPSNQTFGITIDEMNNIWVGTWEGVAKFDGKVWTVPYTIQNNTLFNNHVYTVAFDSSGDIWVGHIGNEDGVSQFSNTDGNWIYHTTDLGGIGGDQIRDIIVRKAVDTFPESIWFATSDGGVSKFEKGNWTVYRVEDGLPSNEVRALAIDKFNRIWAATAQGVAYFDNLNWTPYNSIDTLSIAFGPSCQDCPFDDDHVWTGTTSLGLTHSRVPYVDTIQAIHVAEVCFEAAGKERTCQSLSGIINSPVITVTYPKPLMPGEKLRPEITVIPRTSYQLRDDRGDFLSNTDESDDNLFGAWAIIPVKGIIDSGQPFTFTDYDNPLKAPQLINNEQEKTFSSTWRVWMYTRYVGPSIRIMFTVRK